MSTANVSPSRGAAAPRVADRSSLPGDPRLRISESALLLQLERAGWRGKAGPGAARRPGSSRRRLWSWDFSTSSTCRSPGRASIPGASAPPSARPIRSASSRSSMPTSIGFHTVWCVEHHFRENRSHMPCNEAVLAALSQITERIQLGFGVTLAPHEFIHPARLAEKVATVDLLSQGRVEWGIGRSTPMEQTAFKVDRPRSKEKMRAAARTRRRHVGAGNLRGAFGIPRFPCPDGDAQALSISASAGVDGGQRRGGRADRRRRRLRPAVLHPAAAARQAEAGDRRLSRGAADRPAADPHPHQQGRRLHAGPLRGIARAISSRTGSGTRCGGGTRARPNST